jgi:hypothetical protein
VVDEVLDELDRELAGEDAGLPLFTFVDDVVDAGAAAGSGAAEADLDADEPLQLEGDVLHDVSEPGAAVDAAEKAAANAFRAAMLDEGRKGVLQSFRKSLNDVGRPFLVLADVDLPFDAGSVSVKIRPHECEPFEHSNAELRIVGHAV